MLDVRDIIGSVEKEMITAWGDPDLWSALGGDQAKDREDPGAKLRAIEKEREAARKAKEGKGGGKDDSAVAKKAGGFNIMGMFNKIPGFKLLSGGAGAIFGLVKKLFWPITVIIGIVSAITGFMKEYERTGSIVEGLTSQH